MSHMVHGAGYNVVHQMRNGAELLYPLRYSNKVNRLYIELWMRGTGANRKSYKFKGIFYTYATLVI